MSEAIGLVQARRLALVCAGLFRPRWTGLPSRARGRDGRARRAALAIIRHFGYLQLDTVSIAGLRSHARPPEDRAVLLSPFDPLLWDRARVLQLFDFHQVLEIFKPAAERVYGYYCLPILVGERLAGRCDLKAHRRQKDLEIRSLHFENHATARDRELIDRALRDYADSLNLAV